MRNRRSKAVNRAAGSPPAPAPPSPEAVRRRAWMAVAAIFAAYAAILLYSHGRVPNALNNDVAEEALRGVYLVNGHHFEVITFSVGNSAETLYLYLEGLMAWILGPTVLSIQV